jgi:hypothetical protein
VAEGGVEGTSLSRVCVVGDRAVVAKIVGACVEGAGAAGVGVDKATVLGDGVVRDRVVGGMVVGAVILGARVTVVLRKPACLALVW